MAGGWRDDSDIDGIEEDGDGEGRDVDSAQHAELDGRSAGMGRIEEDVDENENETGTGSGEHTVGRGT